MSSNSEVFTCSCQEKLSTTEDVDRHDKNWLDLGHSKQCQFPGCNKSPPQTSNAKRHWRTHLPERLRKYFCLRCDASYAKQEHLQKHLAKATCFKNRRRCRRTFEEDSAPSLPPAIRQKEMSSTDENAAGWRAVYLKDSSTETSLTFTLAASQAEEARNVYSNDAGNGTSLPPMLETSAEAARLQKSFSLIDRDATESGSRSKDLSKEISLPSASALPSPTADLGSSDFWAEPKIDGRPWWEHTRKDMLWNYFIPKDVRPRMGSNRHRVARDSGVVTIPDILGLLSTDPKVSPRMVSIIKVTLSGHWDSKAEMLDHCKTKTMFPIATRPGLPIIWRSIVEVLAKDESYILKEMFAFHHREKVETWWGLYAHCCKPNSAGADIQTTWSVELVKGLRTAKYTLDAYSREIISPPEHSMPSIDVEEL